jgi:squalene-hopene/tetraprenyl-beta-curcumene cyclase
MDSRDYDESIRRGVAFHLRAQTNGTWEENQYTGTGFPGYSVGERIDLREHALDLRQGIELQRAFMINYNLYRHYFPLMALGRAQRRLSLGW